MIRTKKFIVNLYNIMFTDPEKEEKNRRLIINQETGELSWSKGVSPLGEGPDEEEIAKTDGKEFKLEDDEGQGTRMFEPIPGFEPYRKNRFKVEFPGIPSYFFQSYNYMGTDVHSKKKVFSSNKVIKDDYSSFSVLMLFPHGVDICDKLRELEESPKVGDIKISLLDPTGVKVKTIVIPECEVTEIKAFRDLDYGTCGDKSDTLLMGEIVVKHKQRKLI
jgi:hypothetical protein